MAGELTGQEAFAAVPLAAVLFDADLVFVDATDAYLEVTGRTREQVRGRYLFDAFPYVDATGEDAGSRFEAALREVLVTGTPGPVRQLKYDIAVDGDPERLEERWWSFAVHPVTAADGAVRGVLNVITDITRSVWASTAADERVQLATLAQQLADRRLAGLADVALALVSAETVEELTAIVTDRGLSVLEADGGAVAVHAPDDPDVLQLTITAGFGPRAQREYARIPLDAALPAAVAAATGHRVLLGDEEASLRWSPEMAEVLPATGSQAFASLPLRVADRSLGSLTVGWAQPRSFAPADVELLDAFAAQCAQALDRILVRDAERAAATSARRMSEALQRSMLTAPPQPDHLEIAVRYEPAVDDAQVGGDWYDSFITRTGSTSVVIGDVAGHDRDAAAAMGQVRNLLRGIGYAIGEPPATVLSELDRALRDLAVPALATCVIAQLRQGDAERAAGQRVLVWSSAGHLPPLLLHPDGRPELLRTEPDMLLGLAPETARTDHERVLEAGSTLLLYTDGLVERRHTPLDEGLAWLAGTASRLAGLPLDQLCDTLLDQLPSGVDDDVALIAVRLHPEDRPRPPEAGPQVLPGDGDPDLG